MTQAVLNLPASDEQAPGWASLERMLHFASLVEAKDHFRDPDAQVSEVNSAAGVGPIHGHWMALILLAGSGMRLTLKAFFEAATCRRVLSQVLRKPDSDIEYRLVADFMREFCNRTGGHIKRQLESTDNPIGLSLPLVTRGFDEVFNVTRASGVDNIIKNWSLGTQYGGLTFVAEIVLTSPQALDHFTWSPPENQSTWDGSDELEFL